MYQKLVYNIQKDLLTPTPFIKTYVHVQHMRNKSLGGWMTNLLEEGAF